MEEAKRRLLWNGMFLFLLGLLVGFAEQSFNNPRMGLAAHLEGVINGIFLVAMGAIWTNIELARPFKTAAFWGALYGAYANCLVTTIAAIFGTAALTPITSAGHAAQPWQETLVMVGFMSVGVAMVGTSGPVLWGLRRTASS